jgi:ubiquinone/menaquinone biosynthesis C-methylase UbiE
LQVLGRTLWNLKGGGVSPTITVLDCSGRLSEHESIRFNRPNTHMADNRAIAFHDELAKGWEQKYARASFRRRGEAILNMPGGRASAGEHWLDAGCGTGTLARGLASQGCDVTAVDGSASMIEVARRAMNQSALIRFLKVDDIVRLPFPNSTFDGIVCSSVLEYVDTPSLVLTELARVLRDAGRLIVSVPNRRAIVRLLQKAAHWTTTRCGFAPYPRYIGLSRHEYTQEEFFRLLAAGGFVVRAWRYFGPSMPDIVADSRYAGTLLLAMCVKAVESTS